MAEAVEQAIAEQTHLMVEAGTGTGKKLRDQSATPGGTREQEWHHCPFNHMINLQNQLLDKDIPFLQSIFLDDTLRRLAKGR